MNFRITTLILLLMAFSFTGFSQTNSIEDVTSVSLNNVGAIQGENGVAGYYMFYETDKIDKKTRAYSLQILDNNLEEVARKKIRGKPNTDLVEAAFNGKNIMLKFYDSKENQYKFKSYDMNGVRAKGATRKLSKKEYRAPLYFQGKKGDNHGNALFAIPDKGFVQYASVKNEKWGYIIDFIGGEQRWKYKSSKKSDVIEFAQYVTADSSILINTLAKFKNGFAKGWETSILAIDVNTGDKIFETELDNDIAVSILNGFLDQDKKEILLFGVYFDQGDKVTKAKSKGLYVVSYDMEGNLKKKKTISWAEDASELIKMNKNGKMEGGKYITFHDIVRTADGKIIAVGEQFKKAANTGGIVGNLLVGVIAGGLGATNTSPAFNLSELQIDDMMTFQLSEDLELEDITIIEKEKSSASVPGAGWESPQLMAYLANSMGAFDYSFTQKNEDNSVVSFGYMNWDRRPGEKNGYTFGSITHADGTQTTDEIKLSGSADRVRVIPAQEGNVLVIEYFRKDKKLDIRFEQINF